MKIIFFFCFLFFVTLSSTAQSVAINADGSNANTSAILDVKSFSKGVLIPRVDSVQRSIILSPATGLLVYQTNKDSGFYHFDGTSWQLLINTKNNLWRRNGTNIYNANTGKVGIGTTTPLALLHVIDSSVLFSATGNVPVIAGNTPISGSGRRMMWYPDKAAFRVGYANGDSWDINNIGLYSFVLGNNSVASGINSFASGSNNLATGNNSTVMGDGSWSSGFGSVAIGAGNVAGGIFSSAFGLVSRAQGDSSMSFGINTLASGRISTSFGYNTISSGTLSTTFGFTNTASGSSSFASGAFNLASGNNSTSIGNGNWSNGINSITIGSANQSGGKFSTAFGVSTSASGDSSVSMGVQTSASGRMASSFGFNTTASGIVSTAFGSNNLATGENSTVMGNGSLAAGFTSLALGGGNVASGLFSSAFGVNTRADGDSSMSLGVRTISRANTSTAMGLFTISKSINSLTIGKYNDTTNTNRLFEIGNGTANNVRLNAVTVLTNGNVGIGIISPTEKLHVIGNILASGTITPSDIRYKKNIHSINNALNKVLQLNGVFYNLRTEEFPEMQFDSKTQIGLIAQNVERILPNVVVTSNNGYKAVDYAKLVPLLIEAIKEQNKKIEHLENQINGLKNK